MPRDYQTIPFSPMTGGINRYDREAGPSQLSAGLDVINDAGDLRRRDGFVSVAQGAPLAFPAGSVNMKLSDGATPEVFSTLIHRKGSINNKRVYLGHSEVFDAIIWGPVTFSGTTTNFRKLRLYYWRDNGVVSAWVEITGFMDTTRHRSATGNLQTLSRDGIISWHRSAQFVEWATRTIDGVASKYWVRLDIVNEALPNILATLEGTVTINAPGVRVAHMPPINGLFPTVLPSTKRFLVVGNDRRDKRGVEYGAQLGANRGGSKPTEILRLVEDEGAGVAGQVTHDGWDGSGSWTIGNANRLLKNDTSYDWFYDSSAIEPPIAQFRGAALRVLIVPTSGTVTTVTDSTQAWTTNEWEHCRLRCTAKGAGGTPVAEEREIVSNTATVLTVYDAFSIAPDTNNRFAIVRPHARCVINGVDNEVSDNDNDNIDLVNGAAREFAPDPAVVNNSLAHFEVSRELRWSVNAGHRWSGSVDTATGKLYLMNGESGLLVYDGIRLRKMEADTTSDLANYLLGKLEDEALVSNRPQLLPLAKASSAPPSGKYIKDYLGHMVVAGLKDRPRDVVWSFPGGANNIWPLAYRTTLRDPSNDPITGLAVLGRRLVAFTPSAIFDADPPDSAGQLFFRLASTSLGFSSHAAVCTIPSGGNEVLIGPAADGVYIWSNGQPVAALDDWARVLDGGANDRRLHQAVATVWRQRNLYLLAAPGAGSQINNRLLVLDYNRPAWWAWSLPFGASAMATEREPNGEERILVGTNDGHVMTLLDSPTDEGSTITGTARTVPQRLFSSREASLIGTNLNGRNIGTGTLTFRTFVDKRDIASQSKSVSINASQSVYDTATYDAAASLYADERHKEVRVPAPTGLRGHFAAIEIASSARFALRSVDVLAKMRGQRGRL